jgi:exonuclease SbcD
VRLLHTSDWHLGHTLCNWPRDLEHAAFLAWLLDTVDSERVDALLIAGDVFETSNPSAATLEQWFRFLGECTRRFPELDVVVIGGNHDSAARLDAPNPLLVHSRVRVVGGLPARQREALVVPVGRGDARAWVCAVPFLRMADLSGAASEGKADRTGASGGGGGGVGNGDALIDGVRAIYEGAFTEARCLRRSSREPLIGMGHLYMVGGEVSELSERKILGGNQHAIPMSAFPADVAYVALGHLHKAQVVGGLPHVRYCGSPLPLSTAEAGYRHQVLLVDLDPSGLREVREVLIPRSVEVVRIPEHGAASLPEILAAVANLSTQDTLERWRWPFIDIRVKLEKPEPGLVAKLHEALERRAGRLVRIERTLTGTGGGLAAGEGRSTLRDLEPELVFLRLYEREFSGAPDAALLSAFHETLEAATHSSDS